MARSKDISKKTLEFYVNRIRHLTGKYYYIQYKDEHGKRLKTLPLRIYHNDMPIDVVSCSRIRLFQILQSIEFVLSNK